MNKNVITKMYAGSDKVELSEVNVDLGSIQQLKDELNKFPEYIKQIKDLRDDFKKKVLAIENKASDIGSIYSAVKDNAMKLGVDPESIPEVKNYWNIKKTLTDAVNKAVYGG